MISMLVVRNEGFMPKFVRTFASISREGSGFWSLAVERETCLRHWDHREDWVWILALKW
jgi:hypothetical protein